MYDEIAKVYHLVYPDWDAAIQRQAASLDTIIRARLGSPPLSILDVSCGIGTQSLGLAALGYQLTGSDPSKASIERAKREATKRGLSIQFCVADMRDCSTVHGSGFDVVLSADNAVPHLLSDAAILEAFRGFFACLRPGGIALITVRDYRPDQDRTSPQLWPYGFRTDGDDRYFVAQTRDWDGDTYKVAMYFVREARGDQPAAVVSGSTRYRALTTDRLQELLREAGFNQTQRLDGQFFSPVVVARRPAESLDRLPEVE